ncbi:putative pre-16S rRNA nuclease [Methylacidimicrobium sp. AP8]|uniref:Holliday junction resolvase RuvX n=1 Tax=Methylacidimicrobium sp. AP8 TaxID=2730359 RepID=UPI0018C16366|nr:Holliday junction resolvase RuvX [Methylacidimicrobium sp. AP8]CAB4244323.1 putative pre-16S rRNA nuclease [Methylacidimicrobium sp. AP8]
MGILALDYGSKRIGVAVNDPTLTLALPLGYLPAEPFGEFVRQLKEFIRRYEVSLVLVGLPRNMDGSYGPAAERVRDFVWKCKQLIPIPVELRDERLTTKLAAHYLREAGRKEKAGRQKIDGVAAAVLLQSYLDELALRKT